MPDPNALPHLRNKRTGADRTAVENFLASLDGMTITDAFANARADGKSYGWNAATQTAVAEGIGRHFARRK